MREMQSRWTHEGTVRQQKQTATTDGGGRRRHRRRGKTQAPCARMHASMQRQEQHRRGRRHRHSRHTGRQRLSPQKRAPFPCSCTDTHTLLYPHCLLPPLGECSRVLCSAASSDDQRLALASRSPHHDQVNARESEREHGYALALASGERTRRRDERVSV